MTCIDDECTIGDLYICGYAALGGEIAEKRGLMFQTNVNRVKMDFDGRKIHGLVFIGDELGHTLTIQANGEGNYQQGFTLTLPLKEIRELLE